MKLGIDLGTTNTLAAFVNDHNTPELVPDPRFNDVYITPSVVHVAGQAFVAGEALEHLIKANRQIKVTRNAKLSMGKSRTLFSMGSGDWTAEKIAALILKKIKKDAEITLSQSIGSALIAIPANFDSAERLATQAAAAMAGFRYVELVEEPVAAAASYCFNTKKQDQTLFVYDLGGGTFDATVIHVSADGLYTLSTIGSKQIGGKFFDELIVEEIRSLYRNQFGRSHLSVGALENLNKFAVEAKSTLDPVAQPSIQKSLLMDGDIMDVRLGYEHLSKLIYPMLDESLRLSDQCVRDAGLSWQQIDMVLLVGGSSQLPAVSKKVADLTGKTRESISVYQPHEAIAYGAAILAEQAVAESGLKMILKQQIASVNLGIGVLNPETETMEMELLIERNTPLPQTVKKTFYTNRRHQKNLKIQLLQSKQGVVDFELLGDFSFGPIGNEKDNEPVEIDITFNRDGIVTCTASTASQNVVNIQNIAAVLDAMVLDDECVSGRKVY